MQQHLYTPEGKLRSFVNIYLNDDDVRYLPAKEDSPVSATDELTIIPSIAGGCCLAQAVVANSENTPLPHIRIALHRPEHLL